MIVDEELPPHDVRKRKNGRRKIVRAEAAPVSRFRGRDLIFASQPVLASISDLKICLGRSV